VYDADLKGYFDSIPHSQLLACLRARIVDRSVLKVIRMWLEGPVVEGSEGQSGGSQWSRPKKGTPQGGVASSLLLVGYADDFVALAKQMGSETIEFIESRLEGKFQLRPERSEPAIPECVSVPLGIL
jgi:RNA-directed DNA polymerase